MRGARNVHHGSLVTWALIKALNKPNISLISGGLYKARFTRFHSGFLMWKHHKEAKNNTVCFLRSTAASVIDRRRKHVLQTAPYQAHRHEHNICQRRSAAIHKYAIHSSILQIVYWRECVKCYRSLVMFTSRYIQVYSVCLIENPNVRYIGPKPCVT